MVSCERERYGAPPPGARDLARLLLSSSNLSRLHASLRTLHTGEATAGKTQLCLRLLLRAQAPLAAGGLDGTALWIYTEGGPPLRRLAALAHRTPGLEGGCEHDPASRVLVDSRVSSPADLMAALDRANTLCRAYAASAAPVRLVLVDSVAAIFRDLNTCLPGLAGAAEYGARAGLMFAAAAAMKRLAAVHSLVVVVVNQVVDVVSENGGGGDRRPRPHPHRPLPAPAKAAAATGGQVLRTSGRPVSPALGLAWAHCVDTRLFLARMVAGGAGGWDEGVCGGAGDNPSASAAAPPAAPPHALRCLQVVFAPHLPPSYAYAVVTEAGLVGVRQDAVATAVARAPLGPAATTSAAAAAQQQ